MKKLFMIILSVMMMGIFGCEKTDGRIDTHTSLNDNMKVVEEVTTDPVQIKQEKEQETEPNDPQQTAGSSKDTVDSNTGADNGDAVTLKPTEPQTAAPTSAPKVNPTPKPTETLTEKPTEKQTPKPKQTSKPKKTPTPKQDSKKEYNPDKVVKSAIEKCEANGMITTEHNLDNLLAEGVITKEEYDSYYPLDGLDNS